MSNDAGNVTPAPTPTPNDTSNESGSTTERNDNRGGGNRRSGARDNNRNQTVLDNADKDFVGSCEDLKCVLGLRYEKITAKLPFDLFRKELTTYIVRELKHGSDVVSIVRDLTDPLDTFEKDHLPSTYTAEEIAASPMKEAIQNERIKKYVLREETLKENIQKVYALIWGQCSPNLKGSIEHVGDYEERSRAYDAIWLLTEIKKLTAGIDKKANKHFVLHEQLLSFLTMRQYQTETNDAYMKRFTTNLTSLDLAGGGHVLCSMDLIDPKDEDTITDEDVMAEENKFKAMCLLKRADPNRFSQLQKELEENMHVGVDNYPKTPEECYELLIRRSPGGITGGTGRGFGRGRGRDRGGRGGGTTRVAFAQHGTTPTPGRDGVLHEGIECYFCNGLGHFAHQCPQNERAGGRGRGGRTGRGFVSFGYMMSQSYHGISPDWLLLDTCSTASCVKNKSLVSNLRTCTSDEVLTVITNGGSQTYREIGDLNLFPLRVHYNPDSMANILSFKDVASIPGVRVTMDSAVSRSISVCLADNAYVFRECKDGLYYLDTSVPAASSPSDVSPAPVCLVSTVADNQKNFTREEIQGAERARDLQQQIGWPGTATFKSIVANNQLRNCPITVDDINRAAAIYGPPAPLLFGKKTRKQPQKVRIVKVPLPLPISKFHKTLNLYMDIFYVNRIPFFHTKTSKVNFLTTQNLESRSAKQIIKGLDVVFNIYEGRGFEIAQLHGDNEFDINSLRNHIQPRDLHICAANEHVPIAERSIRTIKERSRCTTHAVPYKRYTKLMTISLVESVTRWLNSFPSKDGVSKTMSPLTIVTGKAAPDGSRKRLAFGSYAIVYTKTKNDMTSRGVPGIALQESNDTGGHYFMSIYSGKKIHGLDWDELPITQEVIDQVHALAEKEKQPLINGKSPIFEWKPGQAIDDDDHINDDEARTNNVFDLLETQERDEVLHPDNESDDDDEDYEPNEESEEDDEEYMSNEEDNFEQERNLIDNDISEDEENEDNADTESDDEDLPLEDESDLSLMDEADDEHNIPNVTDGDSDESGFLVEDVEDDDDIDENNPSSSDDSDTEVRSETENDTSEDISDDDTLPASNVRRSTRTNRGAGVERLQPELAGRTYRSERQYHMVQKLRKKLVRNILDKKRDPGNYMKIACDVMFTQMSAYKGIKMFGERAVAAMFKEYKQLDEGAVPGKPVFGPIDPDTLTEKEKEMALEGVNLIKEKRCGKIKGRTCANGSKQRKYLKEGESVASPTCALESLILTLLIDAYEGRDTAIFDVPGAFLQSDIPKDKLMLLKIRGKFVDIMCEVNPEYKQHVRYENGKKVLYVRILQAIYGCIEAALLWYNLYSSTLEKMGFEINPYDRCVANKMINGKQCTIVWYVDDNKISHVDPRVVTEILEALKDHFGDLTITRGNEFDFLGMKIKMRDDKGVEFSMKEQLEEAIRSFEKSGEKIELFATSPAASHMNLVNEDCPKLTDEKAEIFHSVTAKLLWLMKRVRPDIEYGIAFLCTRTTKSDEDDWKKLKRLLGFIKGTLDDVRILRADSLESIYTWIDAAYAVNNDMKSQTGGVISMGRGIIHAKSSKQKLNTKSSTEAELVGVSEYLPYNIWMINFMKEQGYEIKDNVIFQDNQSAIKMERNGRNSCTGNSRHISIRYFWVKDRVDKGELRIVYCPTENMLADYFTKPLQGTLFKKFRNVIMGYEPIASLLDSETLAAKERVENRFVRSEKKKIINDESERNEKRKEKSYAEIVRGKEERDN